MSFCAQKGPWIVLKTHKKALYNFTDPWLSKANQIDIREGTTWVVIATLERWAFGSGTPSQVKGVSWFERSLWLNYRSKASSLQNLWNLSNKLPRRNLVSKGSWNLLRSRLKSLLTHLKRSPKLQGLFQPLKLITKLQDCLNRKWSSLLINFKGQTR